MVYIVILYILYSINQNGIYCNIVYIVFNSSILLYCNIVFNSLNIMVFLFEYNMNDSRKLKYPQ